jgi:hypothetical protein
VQVSIPFSTHSVDPSLQEDELADYREGENDMEEDCGTNSARNFASVLRQACQLVRSEDPRDDAAGKDEELGEEGEEGGKSDALDDLDRFGPQLRE